MSDEIAVELLHEAALVASPMDMRPAPIRRFETQYRKLIDSIAQRTTTLTAKLTYRALQSRDRFVSESAQAQFSPPAWSLAC